MTFKDKKKEIEKYIKKYKMYELIRITKDFIDFRNGTKDITIHLNNNKISIVVYDMYGFETKEIKFIYNFIEYLESLGFKEGE